MPQVVLETSAEFASRFVPAMETRFKRNEGESDADLFKRWLRQITTNMVIGYERQVAAQGVGPPPADLIT